MNARRVQLAPGEGAATKSGGRQRGQSHFRRRENRDGPHFSAETRRLRRETLAENTDLTPLRPLLAERDASHFGFCQPLEVFVGHPHQLGVRAGVEGNLLVLGQNL